MNAEQRREILKLLVDSVVIDRDDSVSISLAIPTRELVAIDTPPISGVIGNYGESLRYSWTVALG